MVALIETLEFYLRLMSTSSEVLIVLNTNDRSGGAQVNKLPIPTATSNVTFG